MIFENARLVILIATICIGVVCVLVHYEGLRLFTYWIRRDHHQPRTRIAILVAAQLALHMVEIFIFAGGYHLLLKLPDSGTISGTQALEFFDYFYYSATVYSTLGFGDLVPYGPIRILTSLESVTGLLLITWSASFMFIEMRKHWQLDGAD